MMSLLLMLMGVGCAGVSGEGHKKDFLDLAAIRLVDLDGKPIMLTTYQNQVLLIDFFATWSQSTSIIVPAYIQLYRHYQPCGLAMVGIALDDLGAKVVKMGAWLMCLLDLRLSQLLRRRFKARSVRHALEL
jgi:hypothetical protein